MNFRLIAITLTATFLFSGCASTLFDAAKNNDVALAKKLVAQGADVNGVDEINDGSSRKSYVGGNTPLHYAARNGSLDMIKFLVEHGANVNCRNNMQDTPLIDSASTLVNYPELRVKVAELLLANGADPSLRGFTGKTAAEISGWMDTVKRDAENFLEKQAQAEREKEAKNRAERSEMWKSLGTLAVGVAVGNATQNLSSDQQTRMMKSSMQAVQSGDASEFNSTVDQVKAESAQEHQTKMRAIQAQKEQEQARRREREQERTQQANASAPAASNYSNQYGGISSSEQPYNGRTNTQKADEPYRRAFSADDYRRCHQEQVSPGGCRELSIQFDEVGSSTASQSTACEKMAQQSRDYANRESATLVTLYGCDCNEGSGRFHNIVEEAGHHKGECVRWVNFKFESSNARGVVGK